MDDFNNIFNELFGPVEPVKKPEKAKKVVFSKKRINKHGISRFIALEDKKLTEKLPNEFRSEFKNNLDSHTTKYVDSYCGLYAQE